MTAIAAVILAAGCSERFGQQNKLLAEIDGKPVLAQTLDRIAPLALSRKVVVVRPGDEAIRSLIDSTLFEILENHRAGHGMGSSIAAGIRACGDADGAIIALGDMPIVKQSTYQALLDTFNEHPDKTIVAPACEGRRGHPVLFRRQHFDELMALDDDVGAKHIVAANESTLATLPTDDAGILFDIDVPSHSMM